MARSGRVATSIQLPMCKTMSIAVWTVNPLEDWAMLTTGFLISLLMAAPPYVRVSDDTRALVPRTTSGVRASEVVAPLFASGAVTGEERYIVVDLRARQLYLVEGEFVRFSAPVAVGMGTPAAATAASGRFATPRGRLTVTKLEENPIWVPPDWHFAEQARKTGRRLLHLQRGDSILTHAGEVIRARGSDVVARHANGAERVITAPAGREAVIDGAVLVPPLGTRLRQYPNVLGTHRLVLADGYGIHGTTNPSSIGKAASHGCIRMRNSDVAALFPLVARGTPVYFQ